MKQLILTSIKISCEGWLIDVFFESMNDFINIKINPFK